MIMSNNKKKLLELNNICKKYDLRPTNYITFLDDMKSFFFNKKNSSYKYILKNCNLKISLGDSICLIGQNGAGKSTLLKIISGISFPSSGSKVVSGNIASLLSILTSLEQEFTGKENVFFLGAGMKIKKNILQNQMNNIFDFADLNSFINTPVKRYSTGMKVRLAFSICLNTDCNIILADEILTVSDSNFKKKCIIRLKKKISEKKIAIIFVSHDRELNKQICTKGVVLTNGVLSDVMDINSAYSIYNKLK